MNKYYIAYIDILGFEKFANKIAELHNVKVGKVRKDFIEEINEKIMALKIKRIIERYIYKANLDAWLLYIEGLDRVFKFIQEVTNIEHPYKKVNEKIPVEVAIDKFNKIIKSSEIFGDETINFLKSEIIEDYRNRYRHIYGSSPKETYVLISESIYKGLDEDKRKSSTLFIVKGKKFYNLIGNRTKDSELLDITNIFNECLNDDYKIMMVYRPILEYENKDTDWRFFKIKKEIISIINEKKTLLLQIKSLPRIQIDPILKVEFDNELSECVLKHQKYKITLDNPLLLLECSCKVPEEYKNTKYPCRIHSEGKTGKIIGEAFGAKFTKIKYNNVEVFWFDEEPLWPPALDSIFMAKILKEKGYGERIIENALDIGCGTGFLGIFLAKLNRFIKQVYFSDLFITPLLMTNLNWGLNFSEKKGKSLKIFLSDHYNNIPAQEIPSPKFDLVICNPPFLPIFGFEMIYREAAVSGTRLLEKVIYETKKYGKELVIGCSTLAMEEFERSVKTAKAKEELLGSKEVPFRIRHAFKVKELMEKLVSSKRIKQKDESPFKYWHTFYVFKITY